MAEYAALFLVLFVVVFLMMGYPVAFSLAGASLMFATIGYFGGFFEAVYLSAIPERLFGIMRNEILIAVPLFVFMGIALQKGKLSEELLVIMGRLFSHFRGGLLIAVCVVGMLLAASTGIVGATVVTMGLISMPVMMRYGYNQAIASGVITASGTLGQIIPPSVVLVILGDVIGAANQKAQLAMGNFSPSTVSVGDLFLGALFPGLLLVGMYIAYVMVRCIINPSLAPPIVEGDEAKIPSLREIFGILVPPLALIVAVLGSIMFGIASPTEAAALGAGGALVLALLRGFLKLPIMREIMRETTKVTCMVFVIFIGANIFSLVFRGFGGDELVTEILLDLPGGRATAFLVVMVLMFFLGFFLDFIEIVFVVVPIVAPILLQLDMNPVWLGVMIAINLQTSFLTPPFGFALFYLRGVVPKSVKTSQIYRGSIPFVGLQLLLLVILWFFPELATWLPEKIYGG